MPRPVPGFFLEGDDSDSFSGSQRSGTPLRDRSFHCSGCGSLLMEPVAVPANGSCERSSDAGRNNTSRLGCLGRFLCLRSRRSRNLELRLHLTECSWPSEQQNFASTGTGLAPSQGLGYIFGGWAVESSLWENPPGDVMQTAENCQDPNIRACSGSNCSGAAFPSTTPFFVTAASFGAPYTHSPRRPASTGAARDWSLGRPTLTAGEAAGLSPQDGDNEGDGEYSDSSEVSLFVPRPRGRGELEPKDMFQCLSSRDARTSASSGSGLIEPKWPSSWGGPSASAADLSDAHSGPSKAVSRKKGGGAMRKAQETLHSFAAKLRGGEKLAGSRTRPSSSVVKQAWPHQAQDNSVTTQTGLWQKVELPLPSDTSQKEVFRGVPPAEPQPAIAVPSVASEVPCAKGNEIQQKHEPTVAPEHNPAEEESSCCYWLFCCCSAGTPADSAHTNIVAKELPVPVAPGGRAKGKRPPRGRRKRGNEVV